MDSASSAREVYGHVPDSNGKSSLEIYGLQIASGTSSVLFVQTLNFCFLVFVKSHQMVLVSLVNDVTHC